MRMKGAFTALLAAMVWSCAGSDGKNGQSGANGQDGQAGQPGQPGQDGQNGAGLTTGINFVVNGVTVAQDGTVTVDYNMTDDQGAAVDANGVYSKGIAKPRFGLGRIDAAGAQYVTLTRSSSGGPTMLNTANANTGTVAESPAKSGHYTYVFPAKYPDVKGSTATHTVFVQVSRQLDMLDPNSRYVANVTYDFVPAGGNAPTVSRDLVTTAACNQCHDPLAIHGGGRRDVKLCGVCHNADLGNFDLPFFVHAIHSRQNLGADGDFSEVTYPKRLGDCSVCHGGAANGGQAMTKLGAAACTGCHTYLKFDGSAADSCNPDGAWGTKTPCNHIASQGPNSKCTLCHDAEKMAAYHAEPASYWNLANSPPNKVDASGKNPVVTSKIDAVSIDANRIPTFTFTVKTGYDGATPTARDLATKPLQTLRISYGMSLAGAKAVEYVVNGRFSIPGWPGTAQPYPAATGVPGQYTWKATAALPATDPKGTAYTGADTVAFAIESAEGDEFDPYLVEIRGITSDVFFWRIDNQNTGSNKPLARRMIVDGGKCLACHDSNEFGFHHAGSRNNVQACAFCHNAVTTNGTTPTPAEGSTIDQSIQLSVMVHKIHTGTASADTSWAYYGRSGSPLERATYPGNLIDCAQCHVTPSSPQNAVWGLPLNAAVYPTTTTKLLTQGGSQVLTTPKTVAVCTSCHDSAAAQGHMAQHVITVASTTTETCDVCHGQYKEFDVRKLHVKAP